MLEEVVPLRTLDPDDMDFSDLAPGRAAIGEARIVCVGESVHCAREFYLLKHRLLRFLATELGFTAFVLESGFAEGLKADAWVKGGEGDVEDISRAGITYGLGDCEEMRAQLTWMRGWNASHERKLGFYGLDLCGSSLNPAPGIAACFARIPGEGGDDDLLARADFGPLHEGFFRWPRVGEDDRRRLAADIDAVVERARRAGDDIAERCARSAACVVQVAARYKPDSGENARDAFMAGTVDWILGREERILIAAHNGHIQKYPFFGNPTLGGFLSERLASEMVVIGTTCAAGPFVDLRFSSPEFTGDVEVEISDIQPASDGIDLWMDGHGHSLGFADLRPLPPTTLRDPLPMVAQNYGATLPARAAFDALVHVRRVSIAAGMFERAKASIERAKAKVAKEARDAREAI